MIPNIRVLIAYEDADEAHKLAQSLVSRGLFCELARTASAALAILARGTCDIVICAGQLVSARAPEGALSRTGAGGLLLDRLKASYPGVPVLILTEHGSTAEAVLAIKHGASQFLVKPCSTDELLQHVRLAVAERAESALSAPWGSAGVWGGTIVHASSAMKELLQTVEQLALSAAPVLILGETGTGKELVARAIHNRGPRRARPFVAVNTTALPEHLLESELFGHVRGSYTGATQTRLGLFAEADGGTLLLDEIGDMSRTLQPKILRVLQFGEVRAVGSDRPRQVDVRIIAATHRDLDALICAGLFRDDLRYRLNTLVLRIPPLRERREDILPLANFFLQAARARTLSSPVTAIGDDAMDLLQRAPWPGNTRELESTVERLVVLGRQATITARDLKLMMPERVQAASADPAWPMDLGQPITLRAMNQRYLTWVLKQNDGDKARAAEVLGIDISTLYRWQRPRN